MGKPRAASYPYSDEQSHTADMAFVQERDTFTGLYDHEGNPLHRPPERIGFDPHRWDTKPQPPKMRVSHGGRSMGGKEHRKGDPCKICDRENR